MKRINIDGIEGKRTLVTAQRLVEGLRDAYDNLDTIRATVEGWRDELQAIHDKDEDGDTWEMGNLIGKLNTCNKVLALLDGDTDD